MRVKSLLWITILSIILAACQGVGPKNLGANDNGGQITAVRLPLGYIPNIQFAPLYVAVSKGYFRQAGIDVTFDYSFETDAVALVGANELQFAVVSGEQVLMARAQGLPVVYVLAWYRHYPVAVVGAATPDESGCSPQALKGQKIGLPGLYGANYIGLRALLSANGLQESDVILDSIGYTQKEAFSAGRDPYVSVYAANEPVQLAAEGYELCMLKVADYVELASNGLITNEATLKQNPELVRAMVQVLRQGIAETIANPDDAYELSKAYVETLAQADPAIQKAVLAASIELWRPGPGDTLGYSDPQAWENMQKVLLEMGLLAKPVAVDQAFTNEFVEDR
jgi:NitT/TauT family transport system substrate-binding protein